MCVCVCVCMSCLHSNNMKKCLKQGVPYTMALPFTLKKYLKAKEELWKFKYFNMQKFNLQKKL